MVGFSKTLKNIFTDHTLPDADKSTYPQPGRSLFNRMSNPQRANRLIELGDWLKDQRSNNITSSNKKPGL